MKTVLAVDDERHMLRLIEFTLRRAGCRVLLAASGEEALRTAAAEAVDLLISDVGLPGMDGFETVAAFRLQPGRAALPVVMLTARGQATTRDAADAAGVTLFLTKPFSPIELRERVKSLLQIA